MNASAATSQPVKLSEKILWVCAALTGMAALLVGPTVGGTAAAVVIPLVIAGLITAGALAERSKRLGSARPAA